MRCPLTAATVDAPRPKERHETQQTDHLPRQRSADSAQRPGRLGLWRRRQDCIAAGNYRDIDGADLERRFGHSRRREQRPRVDPG
jgi:hypothetical protein